MNSYNDASRGAQYPNVDLALKLAVAGIQVFPCLERQIGRKNPKAPYTQHGFHDASSDVERVRAWWTRHPGALVGIVPGQPNVSALVLDLDRKPGKPDGVTAFEALVPSFCADFITHTPGGGRHMWVSRPVGGHGNDRGALPAGIDVRCDSGYVCLGVLADGSRYEAGDVVEALVEGWEWPDMPDTVAALLHQPAPHKWPGPVQADVPASAVDVELVRSALRALPVEHAEDYQQWLSIGMSLHGWSGGSADGLSMWEDWSSQATNFGQCEEKWRSFGKHTGGVAVGIGTVFHRAQAAGWTFDRGEQEAREEVTRHFAALTPTYPPRGSVGAKAVNDGGNVVPFQAPGQQKAPDVDVRALVARMAALNVRNADALEFDKQIQLLHKNTGVGIGVLRDAYDQERKKILKRAESRADVGDDEPDDLIIDPANAYEENLRRMRARFVLTPDGGGNGLNVVDLTLIGKTQKVLTAFTKFSGLYRYVQRYGEDGQVTRATDELLSDPRAKRAREVVFDPREPTGYRQLNADNGVVNTFARPQHPAEGGSTEVFHRFFRHLLPDDEERGWYLERTAYKWQHPEVRGPGVVMVASATFGTGRGLWQQILTKLWGGSHVVKTKEWGAFCGEGTPGQWNDWVENALHVIVQETRSADENSGSYYAKKAAYEKIKVLVDPAGDNCVDIAKRGTHSYSVQSFMTVDLNTNHADAIDIPDGDRRLAVFTNGDAVPEDMSLDVGAWMLVPENIGALAREFEAARMSVFNPYAPPPMTEAKRRMCNVSKSNEELAVCELVELAKEHDFSIVTRQMIVDWVHDWMVDHTGDVSKGADADKRIEAIIRKCTHALPRGKDRAGDRTKVRFVRALTNVKRWSDANHGERTCDLERADKIMREIRRKEREGNE